MAGGGQRRHQPDLRRGRAPGGVVRARPGRPRAVRRAGAGRVPDPPARPGPLRRHRRTRGADGRRRRPHPGRARRPGGRAVAGAPIAGSEAWFRAQGLPWFVAEDRAEVRSALRLSRLVPWSVVAVVVAVGLGVRRGAAARRRLRRLGGRRHGAGACRGRVRAVRAAAGHGAALGDRVHVPLARAAGAAGDPRAAAAAAVHHVPVHQR